MNAIDRLSSIIETGWLSRLSGVQLAVLLIYVDHAGGGGEAYPGNRRIAELLGHRDRKCIRLARQALVEFGLLLPTGQTDPTYRTRVYRVVISTPSPITPPPQLHPGGNSTRDGGGIRPQTHSPITPPKHSSKHSNNRKRARKPKGEAKSTLPPIPPGLDTPAFNAAWSKWQQHRIETGKPLTPTAARLQLRECEEWGVDRATTAVTHSTKRQWQGIYEPKDHGQHNGNGQHVDAELEKNILGEPAELGPDVLAMLHEPPRPGESGHADTKELPTREAAKV